jgi:exodeoxyribonuclease VII small subunit
MVKKTEPDFEHQMKRLQEVALELERADLPLERNVALYKEGRALVKSCRQLLEQARNEILLCGDDGEITEDGVPVLKAGE